jgi:hypothetical protein
MNMRYHDFEDSPQETTGNLNAMNFYFYIRSLDPAASCREYARYPFKGGYG